MGAWEIPKLESQQSHCFARSVLDKLNLVKLVVLTECPGLGTTAVFQQEKEQWRVGMCSCTALNMII